jgi:hypothetical protein
MMPDITVLNSLSPAISLRPLARSTMVATRTVVLALALLAAASAFVPHGGQFFGVPAARQRAHAPAPRMGAANPKEVLFADESRQKLVDGINAVANAVKVTLGPKGRNVVLERNYGAPEIINDGVTIARDISLPDPAMNVGARLVQEVASKSDAGAGDGTTTSTLLTQEFVNQGMKASKRSAAGIGSICRNPSL